MHLQSYSELVSVTCEKGCYDDVNNNLINSDEYHEEKYPLFYTSSEHPREKSVFISFGGIRYVYTNFTYSFSFSVSGIRYKE